MKTIVVIGATFLAASLLSPAAVAQPRTHTIQAVSSESPYLGIGVQDVDAERAKTLKLKEARGAEVTSVTDDSPAAKAGFKEGDVVWEYNGQPVDGGAQLARLVRETPIGRQVKIVVQRSGAPQTLTPTVEARKGMVHSGSWAMPEVHIPEITIPPIPPMDLPRFQMTYQNPMLGIVGQGLGQEGQLAEFFGVKDGVLVTSVLKDSAAEKAGIKAGDVIVKVDDSKVGTTHEITSALRLARTKKTFTITLVRNHKEMPVTVTIDGGGGSSQRARYIVSLSFRPVVMVQAPRLGPLVLGPLVIAPRIRLLEPSSRDGVI